MTATVWQSADLTEKYLSGVRGAIPLADVQIDIMLRIIEATQPQVKKVLDLGCGDGILGRAILQKYPNVEMVFVDFSEPMLNAARQLTDAAHAHFLQIDYGQPGWVDKIDTYAPFDVIVSGFSIHHQTDPHKRRIYAELFNRLGAGGVFLNLEHVQSQANWIENLFNEVFIDHLQIYHTEKGTGKTRAEIASEFYHRPDKVANILTPVEMQCEWLRQIGFTGVDCFLKIFELALFGGIKPAI